MLATLLPAHYHLHHINDADPAVHEHAVDLHLITANVDHSHHDKDTSIFAATPDVIVKKTAGDDSPYLLLTLLLVLLCVFDRIVIRFRYSDTRLQFHQPYFSPPLRAPPLS